MAVVNIKNRSYQKIHYHTFCISHRSWIRITWQESPANSTIYFWKYVQSRNKSETGVSTLKSENGDLVTDDADKAETLNKFFASVFTRENFENIPLLEENSKSKGNTLCDVVITPEAVENKLAKLEQSKAVHP